MRPRPPALLLALLLLVTASVAWAQPPTCQTALRRIELGNSPAPPPEICISPGLTTTLLFDWPLARDAMALEERERFQRVESAGSLLVLVPSAKFKPGERLRLTVRFAAADAPESATFVLVLHRDQAERQVEVSRAPRLPDSCQIELQRKEAELQRCLHPPASTSPPSEQPSLAMLLLHDVIDGQGLYSRSLIPGKLPLDADGSLQALHVQLHRARRRLVLEVNLQNLDRTEPWQAQGATLLGRSGEVLEVMRVAQLKPLPPGATHRIFVEVKTSAHPIQGIYTLQVWNEGRTRTLTIPNLRLQ